MAKDKFVDSPMDLIAPVPAGYKGGPGTYNGDDCPPAGEYRRTSTPNGPPEKIIENAFPDVKIEGTAIPQNPPVKGLPTKG